MTHNSLKMTIKEASRIFRAIRGQGPQDITLLREVRIYPAETFGEFLLKNKIETYEEVVR